MENPVDRQSCRPIFLMGVLGRSGTNYLSDLVRLHPDADLPAPIWEDHLLRFSHHLVRYVDELDEFFRTRHPEWAVHEFLPEALPRAIGGGLSALLSERAGPAVRPVTKTPAVDHLDQFFRFFPDAHLLVVVRNGQSTVESLVRSFDWSYAEAMHLWAQAAQTVLDFLDGKDGAVGGAFQVVRYEDLLADLEGKLREVLTFIELDPDVYDFAAARSLPVRGSSTIRGEGAGSVHWDPVPRDETFRPLERASTWPSERLERFAWVAGAQMRRFGYDPAPLPASALRRVQHRVTVGAWRAGHQLVRAKRLARARWPHVDARR